MGLLELPNELLLMIGEELEIEDVSHFRINRRLKGILDGRVHSLALKDINGFGVLHWAVIVGRPPLANMGISKGADLNAPCPVDIDCCEAGCTPLHLAIMYDHPEIVRALTDAGARLFLKEDDFWTGDVLVLLDDSQLHLAAKYGAVGTVRALLENQDPGDIAELNREGATAAHLAVEHGHISTLKVFLQNGYDLSTRDYEGDTLLHYAAYRCLVHDEVEKFRQLVEDLGAASIINIKNEEGQTALHLVAMTDQENERTRDLIQILLKNGADPSLMNIFGMTPANVTQYLGNLNLSNNRSV